MVVSLNSKLESNKEEEEKRRKQLSKHLSPALFIFPAGPQPSLSTQPSCTGPHQIGFFFDFIEEDTWDKSFEELRLFVEADGGVAHVSQTDQDRPGLGEWCNTQVCSLVTASE